MMDKLRTAPLPLKKKLLLTALVGAAFFFVGLAAIFFSRDTITVLLSGILAIYLYDPQHQSVNLRLLQHLDRCTVKNTPALSSALE